MSQPDDVIASAAGGPTSTPRRGPTEAETRELAEATYRFVLFVGRWLRRVYGF